MADPREGKVLQGRYRILSMLAEGGMGVVYKAERVGIGRSVVVKFLHAILSDKPGIVDRFEREARATARLNHPHCVSLVDFGIDDGSPYLVVEFVEGKTLADLLDHGAVNGERAVGIVRQILAGLEHAHERGILHRDLKPANVMIVDAEGYVGDFVKILDFGLAKLAWPGEDKRDVTVEGIAIGTPGYMSPEQAAGVPSDRRSDIYCTGALLYHLVTGAKAFEGDDVRSVLRRHREETPASPREITSAAGISKPLEEVIVRAMQREPAKRYQTARDMMAALDVVPEVRNRPSGGLGAAQLAAGVAPPAAAPVHTRVEGNGRVRARRGGRRVAAVVAGLLIGSAGALAAVAYSPLGEYVHPRDSGDKRPEVTPPPEGSAAATASGERTPPVEKPAAEKPAAEKPPAEKPPAEKPPVAEAPSGGSAVPVNPSGTTAAAPKEPIVLPPSGASAAPSGTTAAPAGPAVASGNDDEETDPPVGKPDDGSNEDDRTPAPELITLSHREPPTVRTIADARTLLRKGDTDGALAGLYRLRRARPAPPAVRNSEIASLIGSIYFERRWWTDALREYRFALTLDPRARKNDALIGNSVRALGERTTYARARRLILDYVGRGATPALKRAVKSGQTTALRRRAQKVLATLESKSYRLRR
jgi:serine/threonine-protein kinase